MVSGMAGATRVLSSLTRRLTSATRSAGNSLAAAASASWRACSRCGLSEKSRGFKPSRARPSSSSAVSWNCRRRQPFLPSRTKSPRACNRILISAGVSSVFFTSSTTFRSNQSTPADSQSSRTVAATGACWSVASCLSKTTSIVLGNVASQLANSSGKFFVIRRYQHWS